MGSFSTITSVFSGTPCISRYKSNYSNIRIFCIIRIFEYWFHKKRILFVIRIRPILISEYYSLFVFVLFSLFVATLIHAQLLSFIDYSETTPIISFWKQLPFLNYPQTTPLLRFIPYYSYFQVNKTTQSQNIKATPTLLINFKHSKAILSDNSHCQIT